MGVSFYPHALHRLFDIDAQELTNTTADLTNFCPRNLQERMFEAVSHGDRIVLLTKFLIERLAHKRYDAQLINECVFSETGLDTGGNLDEILHHYPLSQRQLERRFRQWVGVSPKTYLRLIRFEQALHLLGNTHFHQVQDIAYTLNYADHSHFTREFRNFSGYTPKDYLRVHKKMQESTVFILNE